MASNILTNASSRISRTIKSYIDIYRLKSLYKHFGAVFEFFWITWKQRDVPPLASTNADGTDATTDIYLDHELFQTSLIPKEFAHFSDGIPLTDKSLTAWKRLTPVEKSRRNAKHLQESVVRWQDLMAKPIPTNAKSSNLNSYYIVFMHIPKAGGTTLQHILAKNYLPSHLIHANNPEIIKHPGILFKMRDKHPRPIMMGHFDRAGLLYEFLNDRPIIHFTMLRDPIKRVLSHFNYRKTRRGHRTYSQFEDLTLEQYAASSISETCNKQTLRILGYSGEEALEQSIHDPEPLLAEATQALEQEFTFFGLTERYTEFLLMAKNLLGWRNIVYERQNSSSKDERSKQFIESNLVTEEALQIIRDRNQLDIQLYKFASELFDKRCKAMGIDEAVVEKYDQISQRYKTVLADLSTV